MESSSRDTVLNLFQLIIQWKNDDDQRAREKKETRGRETVEFNWTSFHLEIVRDYVSRLSLDSDFRVLSLMKSCKDESWYSLPTRSTIDASLVASFAQELKEFFVVPKQHQLFQKDHVVDLKKLLRAFIGFLIRLLHSTTGSIDSVNDRIDCLKKKLTFLPTFVWDQLLIHDEHEQVQHLSTEIEAVVNEAGSLVHSIVFSTFADPIFETMDERLGILLKHFDSLHANVIKFLNQQPVIAETNTTLKTSVIADSSFIIDSVIQHLEDRLAQKDNRIAGVKGQIKVLRQELKFSQSLIKELKLWESLIKDTKASQFSEPEKLKELVMQTKDAASKAEMLLFLVGHAPWQYCSIRLSHVLNKIKLLNTEIQGTKKNYDIKVARNFTAQLSLQNKRSSKVDDIIVQNIETQMDSSSRYAVSTVFQMMIEWRKKKKGRRKRDTVTFNWTLFHLSVVHDYVLNLSLDSGLGVLNLVKLFCYLVQESPTIDANLVVSFIQELKEFFVVPKQHQLFERDDVVDQNELVAAFIDFLLRLLHRRTGSVNSVKNKNGIDHLEEELRFLLTVVGDILLIRDEHEQVQNLSVQIEAVVNEAGSLVHSIVFSAFADPIFEAMDERLGVLLKHIDSFKANVTNFSNQQPVIEEINITPKTAAEGSLFIIHSLLYDLEGLLNQEDDNMIADVKDQIKVVWDELKISQSLIKDIKTSQHSEAKELKEPVMRIRDAAYEAEYLINSFLVGDAPFWYFSIRLSHVLNKIKLFRTGIQGIKENYDICASTPAKDFNAQLSLQNRRSSKIDDIIVGFEDRAVDILEHLEGETKHLQLICIFGMAGLGKTTLAKTVYNHPRVKYRFDRCSWCVVSKTYHRKNLLIDILVSLKSKQDRNNIENMDEERLEVDIHKSLKGRRYLIVIDDIWSSKAHDDLQRCFPDDGNGSRILFTSRNKDVAPPNSIIYELPCMSDEQCWELLEKKVFQSEHCPPQLQETGKKIATNCHGLPLAAVVVAGILSSMDKEESTWKNVEGNLASYIFSDPNNSMVQILELSYKHLPHHLKPCFLYFGAFPEDMKIDVRKLKCLWVAEGFIHREEKKSAESVAEEYLMELIDKSLVIVAERRKLDGGVKSCVIHDLLRDLCLKRCEEEDFLKSVDKYYTIYEKHHRQLVRDSEASGISLAFGLHTRSYFGWFPNLGVRNMKSLRVLDLLGLKVASYVDNLHGIKLLVHLRYLAINHKTVSLRRKYSLAWIDSLVNLEFLVVEDNLYLEAIPSAILKMMKLRYVNIITSGVTSRFEENCDSFQTNNLEFLGSVFIGSLKDEEILKCSPRLRKLKCECEALWDEETGALRYPDFGFLTQLELLRVQFRRPAMDDTYVAPPNLPLNLKKLNLWGLHLPWEKMSIIGGLPNLQVLKLAYDACVGEIWETRDGEFQQLTFLQLGGLGLVQWNVHCSQHFPKLRHLVLISCYGLQEIPSEVGEIVTLQLIEIKGENRKSLVESARQIEQEQRENGNEELKLCVEDVDE